jgi:protein-S-isoprenylcysteine O-methyltransferase Ste14
MDETPQKVGRQLSDPQFLPDDAGVAPRLSLPYLLFGFFFKVRGLLVSLPLFAMFLITRGEWHNTVVNWAVGLPMFGMAALLRIRSQQYLRYRLREHSGLTTAGPYSYVRNPVYIANSAGLAALCVMCGLYWMAPLVAAWAVLVYHLALRFEEMRLEKRFGEQYRVYRDHVPRWVPLRSPGVDANKSRARFWRAARVEWQTLLLLLVPLFKGLSYEPQGGKARAMADRLLTVVPVNGLLFWVIGSIGVVALVGWRLKQWHTGRRPTRLPTGAGRLGRTGT